MDLWFAIWYFCLTFDLKELGIRVTRINILDFSTYSAHFYNYVFKVSKL
jgi:hypothetical protein